MQPVWKETARASTLLSVNLFLSCTGVFVGSHVGPNSSQSCARATWLGPARLHVLIDDQIEKAKHCQEHKLVNSGDRKLVTLFGPVFLGFLVRHVLPYTFVYQNLVFNLV